MVAQPSAKHNCSDPSPTPRARDGSSCIPPVRPQSEPHVTWEGKPFGKCQRGTPQNPAGTLCGVQHCYSLTRPHYRELPATLPAKMTMAAISSSTGEKPPAHRRPSWLHMKRPHRANWQGLLHERLLYRYVCVIHAEGDSCQKNLRTKRSAKSG